nr:MAG TPA: hypothetical protein [Caudoviricetes sp.]
MGGYSFHLPLPFLSPVRWSVLLLPHGNMPHARCSPTIRAERSHFSCGTACLMQGRSLPCKPDGTQTDSNCDTTESNAG